MRFVLFVVVTDVSLTAAVPETGSRPSTDSDVTLSSLQFVKHTPSLMTLTYVSVVGSHPNVKPDS